MKKINNNRKTIKEWEEETGIKVKDTRGFSGKKNKRHNYTYTEKEFRKGVRSGEIKCKTEKGLEFLNR